MAYLEHDIKIIPILKTHNRFKLIFYGFDMFRLQIRCCALAVDIRL
jgi:hypothetical protein